MRLRAAWLPVFAAVALLAACDSLSGLSGDDGPAAADGGVDGAGNGNDGSSGAIDGSNVDAGNGGMSVAVGCAKFAEAFCAKRTACSPKTVQTFWGGPAGCEKQVAVHCASDLASPGVKAKPEDYAQCATDLAAQSCDDHNAGKKLPSCALTGDLAEGASCITDIQCTTGLCAQFDDKGCGRCRVPAKENEPCGVACEYGLVCSSGKCIVPRKLNEQCTTNVDCARSLQCGGGGTCVAWAELGQPCGTGNQCNADKPIGCAQSGYCENQTVLQPGTACTQPNTAGIVCLGGLCTPIAATPTCTAWANENEACTNRPCLDPYECIAGQCVLPKAAFCTQ